METMISIPAKEWNEVRSILYDIRDEVKKIRKDKENELLTPNEVCKILKISRNTYQRYVDKEIFEQIQINKGNNGKVYVKRSEIERLIQEGRL